MSAYTDYVVKWLDNLDKRVGRLETAMLAGTGFMLGMAIADAVLGEDD